MFEARVILDSIAPHGRRLTTMLWTYPRFIHAEILTHRDRARNSASSRAIPWPVMMERIEDNPVIPIRWGSEKSGMQTGGEIEHPELATRIWLSARDNALESARQLAALGVHKSLVNRVTEPWMWITVVMTATVWENLWRLRCHSDAEIHFQEVAGMARKAMEESVPQELGYGGWHLPFVTGHPDEAQLHAECDIEQLKRISTARCARVSYLTHDGVRDPAKDLTLFERLSTGSGFGHWSPPEHVAQAHENPNHRSGPFVGWHQFRKEFALESADVQPNPLEGYSAVELSDEITRREEKHGLAHFQTKETGRCSSEQPNMSAGSPEVAFAKMAMTGLEMILPGQLGITPGAEIQVHGNRYRVQSVTPVAQGHMNVLVLPLA